MATEQQQNLEAWTVSSQSDVAEFFQVARSTVNDWVRHGMPGEAGRYDLSLITRWLFSLGPWKTPKSRDEILQGFFEGR
jgi:hypothetical protein